MKIDETLPRPDGRAKEELRNIKIEVGILKRADGSARVELGHNIVIAAVNGPRELHPKHSSQSQKAVVRITYRMLPFSVEYRKNPYPSRREKEISKVLSEAFESAVLTHLFPRAAIDIQVEMIQSDGGSRTASAIAVSAALADAGIPMRGLVAGIASGLYKDEAVLDLCGYEDNVGSGDMPILYAPLLDEVSLFQLDGRFTLEKFKECFNMSVNACKIIEKKQRDALQERYIEIRETFQTSEADTSNDVDPITYSDSLQEKIEAENIPAETEISAESSHSVASTEPFTTNTPVDEVQSATVNVETNNIDEAFNNENIPFEEAKRIALEREKELEIQDLENQDLDTMEE